MRIIPTTIPGCHQIFTKVFSDERGFFVKTFHRDIFLEYGLETNFSEQYYSASKKGVLRGLHFQMPPYAHAKLVYCTSGGVLDVVVDLRIGSPTYGKYEMFELTEKIANAIYIPKGLAHGFMAMSENATMVYNVTNVYAQAHDTGIKWDSVGIPWPEDKPIISKRDSNFYSLSDFSSPFQYEK